MAMHSKIRFQGNDYILIGDIEEGGAIATEAQYENGECSYAHLCTDGLIRRFRQVIGRLEDLEFVGTSENTITVAGAINTLLGKWPNDEG